MAEVVSAGYVLVAYAGLFGLLSVGWSQNVASVYRVRYWMYVVVLMGVNVSVKKANVF